MNRLSGSRHYTSSLSHTVTAITYWFIIIMEASRKWGRSDMWKHFILFSGTWPIHRWKYPRSHWCTRSITKCVPSSLHTGTTMFTYNGLICSFWTSVLVDVVEKLQAKKETCSVQKVLKKEWSWIKIFWVFPIPHTPWLHKQSQLLPYFPSTFLFPPSTLPNSTIHKFINLNCKK